MNTKLERTNKLLPWYLGLSDDLIFFAIINTIWLVEIKNFNPFQVTLLTTISSMFCIVLQIPLLRIIKKIGNAKSIQIGSFILLLSSILLTFSERYIWFIIAMILYELSFIFKNMGDILLKNNLNYLNHSSEFLFAKTKANTIYAVLTAIIALLSGYIFHLNSYLPMILGISVCILTFMMSLFLFDITDKRNSKGEIGFSNKQKFQLPDSKRFSLIMLFLYGLFYGIVVVGQRNGQLLIQFNLKEFLDLETVATVMGIIIFISRICRISSNFVFLKLYQKYHDKVITILSLELLFSFLFLLLGSYLNGLFWLKVVIMTFGFSLILEVRAPIKTYMQNLTLNSFTEDHHQNMITYLGFFRKIGTILCGGLISCVLSRFSINIAIFVLLLGGIITIVLSFLLEIEIKKR